MTGPVPLESLSHDPVAGPTEMTRAHRNGLRRAVARAKAWFKPGQQAEACLKVALLTYLAEWEKVYGEGTMILGLTTTERTILTIRRDTVQQMLREIG
jgi:hypothetical protein